jgi:hypothetical protein
VKAMSSKIKYFNEKYFYKLSVIPNIQELLDRKMCERKGTAVIFVRTGIIMLRGLIYVILPCGYRTDNSFHDIQVLLDLFERIANEKKMDNEFYDQIEIELEGNGHLLTVSHELIKDFKENGLIRIDNTVEGINIGGRINWKKTVKQKNQMFTEEGIPIYTDLVMTRKENNKDELMCSLHRYAVNKSIAMYGILFGIGSGFDESAIELPIDREVALSFLKSERQMTYNSRFLRVIDLVIRFIDSTENESINNDFISLTTKSFYTVWELMCKELLRDEFLSMREMIPRPYWQIGDSEPKYTEQIPDIVFIDNNELFLLDSKYYNINKNIPGWHDLVKQYFYEISLKSVLNEVKASYNIMLIPYDIVETARFWGVSKVENVPGFGEVKGILLNTKKVIEHFNYGGKENYRLAIKRVIPIK